MEAKRSPRSGPCVLWLPALLVACSVAASVMGIAQPDSTLLRYVETVQVTPDAQYLTGGFARINYVPGADRLVVTFVGELAHPDAGCDDKGASYKTYTLEMKETGESGTFACDPCDAGSAMVGNTYYFAAMTSQGEDYGWHLLMIDATTWTILVDRFHPVDSPQESQGDNTVVFVNGRLDISGGYTALGREPGLDTPAGTYGTHHHFFSPELEFLGKLRLTAPPHITGSSLAFVEGSYYLVTANLYDGDLLVAKYDTDWNYLGGKTLIRQAHFSTGLAYDDQRFYVAYLDTSQRAEPGFFPVFLNVHLAIFDREWNLLEDIAVTNYARADHMQPGRPWVILHGDRLYVSYDLDTRDPISAEEHLKGQAYVAVYGILRTAS